MRRELYPRVGFIVTSMSRPAENVVAFDNKRGTCEQWIKEGKASSASPLAYNLGNFLRTLATPEPIKDWSRASAQKRATFRAWQIVGFYDSFRRDPSDGGDHD